MVAIKRISLEDLEISPYNVRLRDVAEDIDELARSLQAFGLKQPIVVYRSQGKFQVLIGQRRFRAAKKNRWKDIDAIVEKRPSELDARVISFTENVQRVDLNPRDKADTCSYLLKELGSVRAVAKRLGISENTVRKWLDYAAVPDAIKKLVDENKISRPIATRIALTMEDDDRAFAMAKRVGELRPTKPERDRIMAAVEEMPDRSVEAILRRAESLKLQKRITFVLPANWSKPMERAAKELQLDDGEIAREATIEWLKAHRY